MTVFQTELCCDPANLRKTVEACIQRRSKNSDPGCCPLCWGVIDFTNVGGLTLSNPVALCQTVWADIWVTKFLWPLVLVPWLKGSNWTSLCVAYIFAIHFSVQLKLVSSKGGFRGGGKGPWPQDAKHCATWHWNNTILVCTAIKTPPMSSNYAFHFQLALNISGCVFLKMLQLLGTRPPGPLLGLRPGPHCWIDE